MAECVEGFDYQVSLPDADYTRAIHSRQHAVLTRTGLGNYWKQLVHSGRKAALCSKQLEPLLAHAQLENNQEGKKGLTRRGRCL